MDAMIKKVLIVNRSEIALRVQQACRALGYKVVAVYAPEDFGARFVCSADEAYELSGHGFAAYLNQDEIISIALKSGADAVHPGYGFLSENARFAQKVQAHGIIWIGPSPDSMMLMGDKIQARQIAQAAGVPVVPGRFIRLDCGDSLARALQIALEIGFPVIIKDPLAGGGKAMRRVSTHDAFADAWDIVVSESRRISGGEELLVEKYLEHGRHIEVQIAGDGASAIHLFERECSIQRRHQKIVEEAPCAFVPQELLTQMYQAAINLAQSVKYTSVGTVEFMVVRGATEHKFYFLEMNTRLQVEHSVTELTTGIDLVALQFALAQGAALPAQHEIIRRGHAIECRIYAEDPDNNFFPSTGVIQYLQLPNGPWMRHDHDLEESKEITPFFDPMIAKITTYGPTRSISIGYMLGALHEYIIGGVITNISFLQRLLAVDWFVRGDFDTQSLAQPEQMALLRVQEQGQVCESDPYAIATALIKKTEHEFLSAHKCEKQRMHVASAWKGQQWK